MRLKLKNIRAILAAGWLMLSVAPSHGDPPVPPTGDSASPAKVSATRAATVPAGTLTVAILNFKADTPAMPDLGQQISDVLVAALADQPGITLVDRSSIDKTLKELELSKTGLVSTQTALKVGKLVGAKILISGYVIPVGKDIYITAKIIGVETTLVKGVMVIGKDQPASDLGPLLMQLSEKLSHKLVESGQELIAHPTDSDPLPALKARLQKKALPKVAVTIPEQHITSAAPARDPAVETEIRKLLLECGFTVIDAPESEWPHAGVEVGITGAAFTERAGQIGSLITCTDRVEIKLTNLPQGTLRLSDRDNGRAVDLAENLAAKTALQKSGRALGIRILEHFADTLPTK